MSTRLLVTGGQGFLGRHVVAEWLLRHSAGRVLALGRSPRNDRSLPHPVHRAGQPVAAPVPTALSRALDDRYDYVALDSTDRPALTRLLATFRPDVVIHLAGALRGEPLDRLLAVNVDGVAALLSAIAGASLLPRAIVLGSSGAVYGLPTSLPLAEDAATTPLDLYGVSKQAGESVGRILGAQYGLPVVIARIFNPLGPGQDERHLTSAIAMQSVEIAAGRRQQLEVGPLDTTRDFLDARDAAVALALLAERGVPGTTYNVASGVETGVADVLTEGLRAAGLPADVPIERLAARASDVPRHFADISRLRALGFRPAHSLGSSMEAVVAYYRDEVGRKDHEDEGDDAADPPAETMTVTALARHSYPVEVAPGILATVPDRLATLFPGAHLVMLTDRRVHELYGARLFEGLSRVDANAKVIFIGEGEPAKSLDSHQRLIGELHRGRFDRRAVLVNLGGGVVIDTGGFVAASYMRGVAYVNVPTTLLAQHDAAVGGKVAVNTSFAKNFVGAFHHPRAVFSDPTTLATLDDRHIAAGIAEAIKVAICGDEELFCLLERDVEAIRQRRDARILGDVVRRATRKKIELLAPDPYENDLRRALNLGHSFGHPLETELEYTGILHGEAVGFGLAVAVEVARARRVCPDSAAERILALLARYGLPPKVPRARLHAACARMAEIRLVRGCALHFVLPADVARVEIVPHVDDDEIRRAIDAVAWHSVLGGCVLEEPAAENLTLLDPVEGTIDGPDERQIEDQVERPLADQNRMLTLGVDVGGSKILTLLVDDDGHVLEEQRQETGRALAPDELVRRVAEMVRRHRDQGRAPTAIGVGIPGLCDYQRGQVHSSIMLDGWRDVPLAAAITAATALPCAVDNDVNAAAVCEAELRGLASECMLFVAVGTGIGGALTFGRQLWRGASGVAGELGNVVIDRGGRRCWCGRHGCLNTLASGSAIEESAGIAPGALAARLQAGDEHVVVAIEQGARALAIGLGNAVNLLNPSLIVLGGGVAELGPAWLAAVRGELARQAFPEALSSCRVELARAGYAAGARGAALLARALIADRVDCSGAQRVA